MFYRTKHNLTVGLADRGHIVYKAGVLYKKSELVEGVDMTNFSPVEDDEARAIMAKSGQKQTAMVNGSADTSKVPAGDIS